VSLTSKYNYHLRKAIPLREHFLTVLSIGKWDTYNCNILICNNTYM